MRSQRPPSAIRQTSIGAIVLAAAALALSACAPRPRAVVALDEAFAATRPRLCSLLEDPRTWSAPPFSLAGAPIVVPLTLGDSPGAALEAAAAERKRSGIETAIVASPLAAKAIVRGGAWSGEPSLLVPEWEGEGVTGLIGIDTDPIPAYRAAGEALGSYIAALAEAGGSPSCGIIFSEAPERPDAALAAFTISYAKSSGGRALLVRNLSKAALPSGPPEPAGIPGAAAPSATEESRAEAAAAELLGMDLRAMLVALGPGTEAALRAAARPGLALGADLPYPETPPILAFRIVPDEPGLAKALAARLRPRRDAGPGTSAAEVPALLVEGARAGDFRAGKLGLKALIAESALRAKGIR